MTNRTDSLEPNSLNQIIGEDEFLPLLQEAGRSFFKIFNSFKAHFKKGGDISRKFYSNLIQITDMFESFLDEHGARENKTWYFFTEYIASIRNLAIAAFFVRHILDRYPYYNLAEDETARKQYFADSQNALDFLNTSICNLYDEVQHAGRGNRLNIPTEVAASSDYGDVEAYRTLPRNIEEDHVKNEEERIIDICQKYRNAAKMVIDAKIEKTTDVEKLKALIPACLDEKKARFFKNLIHSVQSDYDTYVKNTRLELAHPEMKNFRGYISLPMHLLEAVLWLNHFYERHEDEIRSGECKKRISALVNKNDLLCLIVNFSYFWAVHFIQKGDLLSEQLLKGFSKTVHYELPIPKPLGLHARPSTYISLIVRQHAGEAFVVVDGEKFNAKSVMSLLQAGGAIADRGYQNIVFEGDKQILDDIRILAKHNYCEDKNIPRELSYLRAHSS
jgi:phosphotransferase system HPr (HPr) family protein